MHHLQQLQQQQLLQQQQQQQMGAGGDDKQRAHNAMNASTLTRTHMSQEKHDMPRGFQTMGAEDGRDGQSKHVIVKGM